MGDRYRQREVAGLKYGIVEVTTSCQLRCPGCYMVRRDNLNTGQMELAQAVRVLDLCREFTGRELETMDILGGEPLLWPHLQEFIELLLSRGIAPWVFTNMIAIKPEMARWLFARGIKITGKVNVDPGDPSQLALQARMIGRFERVANRMLAAVQVFLDAGYRAPQFFLENLLRRSNIQSVPAFYRWCLERGIGPDIEMLGCGDGVTEDYVALAPTKEQVAEMIGQVCQVRESFGIAGQVLMPHVFSGCRFYDSGLYFAVDSTIRACSNSAKTLARMDDHDPVVKAWQSDLLCWRRELTQAKVAEPCHSCDRWDKCRGGCRATVEGMSGSFGGYTLCPVPLLK